MPETPHDRDVNWPAHDDVAALIRKIAGGDEEAANHLWGAFFPELTRMVRALIGRRPLVLMDEEDISLEALLSFCLRARKGAFERLASRGEVWCVLEVAAKHRLWNARRDAGRLKAGGGRPCPPAGFDQLCTKVRASEESPLTVDEVNEMVHRRADATLLAIMQFVREGYTQKEIARILGVSLRTITREIGVIRRRLRSCS